MSDYQGKRFSASRIPDPAKSGAARAPQQGRTSSPQQPRAPRPVTPAKHRRQDTLAAYHPSSYSTAKKSPRSSAHTAPSSYTEPPRKKRRSVIPILLIIIGIGLIVAAAAIFINAQIGYKQASESYQKIEKQYVSDKDASGVPIIDFNALAQTNPEVVGWIYAPGTNINYAVVQSAADDLFYDDHGVDRSYYSGGSIFSQRYNTTTFQDPVTVLYGHNRQSQTMFAQVNNFADAAFFAKNQKIFVYTPDKVYEYTIFAAYPHSSEHLLLCHDFTDPQQFAGYFASLGEAINANYRRELFPQAGDKVLTLSTCYRQNRMQRFLVQGVLTETYDVIK